MIKVKIKTYLNDSGFIPLAFAVVIISLMSVIAIAHIAVTDTHGLVNGYHMQQELHLLRGESDRAHKITLMENGPFSLSGGFSSLPAMVDLGGVRRVYDSGFGKSTFKVRTIAEKEADVTGASAFDVSNVYAIKSLATVRLGAGNSYSGGDSPVEMYSRRIFKNESYAGYHYFTDDESSINVDIGDPDQVKFYGRDEIHGRVRSNSDIYIQNSGHGNNGGWPTFFDEVYTSGEVISISGNYPRDQVFRRGLTENLPELEFPTEALAARTGTHIEIGVNDVLMVKVSGTSFTSYLGTRIPSSPDSVVIYGITWPDTLEILPAPNDLNDITLNQLPGMQLDTLDVQLLTKIDTLWTNGPSGRVNENSICIEGELWLEGTFTGKQTWACEDTLFLTGDILLSGTDKGSSPDGSDGPMNTRDMVGLVSEKSILIQYGYRHPEDSIRVKNNCGRYEDLPGDEADGGIYIYAAMIALGDGETSMEDGVFSFQYQHPHPGLFSLWRPRRYLPGQTEGQELPFNFLELETFTPYRHRLMFDGWGSLHAWPLGSNWPPDYGYPFYGPLWPETRAESFRERGTISIFGSVAQRRRGFVHRSGNDNVNTGHPWDIANYHYGSHPSAIGIPNAPGATGPGVGYQKNYNYDNRFRTNPPPKFPEAQLKGGVSQFDPDSWYLLVGKEAPQILRN